VIVSTAPGHVIARIRRASGPNPEGSKLGEKERLHLIYMVGAMHQAGLLRLPEVEGDLRLAIRTALTGRGMTADQVADVFHRYRYTGNVVAVVNAIAVHPDLRDNDYLD